ncbi:hypothetical protein FSP39_011036 [Pinctada imbricata]|uniref:U4/U6.U5 tri-snRNP-associated protein 1 n=1 Tax=Pinctada imbricata TaxID=66713 RepID=A0AA88XWD6_PINIB|nr:hypothetical protein FSP39_011036 [Pinctada imbricata]
MRSSIGFTSTYNCKCPVILSVLQAFSEQSCLLLTVKQSLPQTSRNGKNPLTSYGGKSVAVMLKSRVTERKLELPQAWSFNIEMGSSKKHKDKDKEHKRKRKNRSRSRSKDRSERKKHRHGERSRDKHDEVVNEFQEEYSDDFYPKELEDIDSSAVRGDTRTSSSVYQPSSSSGDLSLSIEETNRIRAKLGLKPLEVNYESKAEESGGDVTTVDGDIHKPAVSLTEKRETKKIQERIQKAKEKRHLKEKLSKVKTLGESDSDDDVKAWVKKSRAVQKEREMAEKRAKMLEEMDQEFGVGNLIEEEFKDSKKQYSSRDLRGLRVEHDTERFKEGQTVILTLQDKGVLEDEGDTLVNVNMIDDERADKNKELRKKKPDYNPYDDGDVDEYGMFRPKKVLSKYDEEIEGLKKEKFELGSGGTYDTDQDRQMELIRQQLRNQSQSLDISNKLKIASEYLTEQEVEATKFKKVKKKNRKIRKKETLKADDLLPMENQDDNFGSRSRGRGMNREAPDVEEFDNYGNGDTYMAGQNPEAPAGGPIVIDYGHGHMPSRMDPGYDQGYEGGGMEVDPTPVKEEEDEDDLVGPDEDLTGVAVDEDGAQNELHSALSKARRLKQRKVKPTAEKIAAKLNIKKEPEESMEEDMKANITLNAMSEFCRTLGDIPTYGQSGNRDEEREELLDFERELMEERRRQEEEEEQMTGWNRVEIDETPVNIAGEDQQVLDDEPIVNAGVGAALELATKKGFFEKEFNKKRAGVRKSKNIELEAQNYSIEDKRYDDLDEKFRKRDRYSGGAIMDFKEKDTYKPDVKLEYVDDSGRMLNEKEAFRQLSHRFHGKGSGKKKTEKRSKKLQEETLMKMMSSTDTPLGTLNMLQEKQKAEKSPYIVLSGNKSLTA